MIEGSHSVPASSIRDDYETICRNGTVIILTITDSIYVVTSIHLTDGI